MMMKNVFLFLFLVLLTFDISAQNNVKISKTAALEDLEELYLSLPQTHCNLFAYTSKQKYEETYELVKSQLTKDSFEIVELTNIFQPLASVMNNGHTEVPFPFNSYVNYVYGGGMVFPLELNVVGEEVWIRKNWSKNTKIATGLAILSINGRDIHEIIADMYLHISAERLYFKNAKLAQMSFPRLYWQLYGEQETFDIVLKENAFKKHYKIEAIKALEEYEYIREDVLNAHMEVKMLPQAAYLNPGHFSGDLKQYQQFIDSAFDVINTNKAENLIIDLRNNSGGDDVFSDYLLSYFMDKPFHWCSKYKVKASTQIKKDIRTTKDTTSRFWRSILAAKDGSNFIYQFDKYTPQPQEKMYKGKVYVLINRQSHSQSTVAATQFQDYALATLVGEETAEYGSLYASLFIYQLSNSKIPVHTSKGYIVRVSGDASMHGVQPDIKMSEDLFNAKDDVLESLLKMLAAQ